MSRAKWNRIVLGALCSLLVEFWLGFPFYFAPGWANGWPGLSIYEVWSAAMASFLFVMMMTAAVGLGAAVGSLCAWCGIGLRHGRLAYTAWLIGAAVLTTLTSLSFYESARAATLEMWPNGYPGHP